MHRPRTIYMCHAVLLLRKQKSAWHKSGRQPTAGSDVGSAVPVQTGWRLRPGYIGRSGLAACEAPCSYIYHIITTRPLSGVFVLGTPFFLSFFFLFAARFTFCSGSGWAASWAHELA
jgi:hypothetical protein